jgi:hypothetical protein
VIRMSRRSQSRAVRRGCLGVYMLMLLRAKRVSLFAVLTALLALTCAPSAQALTVEHVEATFPVEETIDDICAFPIALSGTTSVRVAAFRDDEGNFVKVILHFSSTLTMSANGKTLSGGERYNEFDVDFAGGGAPSTIVKTGVFFPTFRLPGGGTIVQAGRIVEDVPTDSIVFEKGNLGTEGDVSALCEALS